MIADLFLWGRIGIALILADFLVFPRTIKDATAAAWIKNVVVAALALFFLAGNDLFLSGFLGLLVAQSVRNAVLHRFFRARLADAWTPTALLCGLFLADFALWATRPNIFSEIAAYPWRPSSAAYVWICAYLLAAVVLGPVIAFLLRKWSREVGEKNQGLLNAGMWIGGLERVAILAFVQIGALQGIGFLIAAKSVFRFKELSDPDARKGAEYIFIGTLVSLLFALALAATAQALADRL